MAIAGRRRVAIFRVDEGVFAIDNLCLHQADPLADGVVEDGVTRFGNPSVQGRRTGPR